MPRGGTYKQNFKPLTSEQAREYGSRGGIKSAKVKKEKKSLRAAMLNLLQAQYQFEDSSTGQMAKGDGYEMWAAKVVYGVMNNDRKCMEYLRDIIGENPATKLTGEGSGVDSIKITFVDKSGDKRPTDDPKIVGESSPNIDGGV